MRSIQLFLLDLAIQQTFRDSTHRNTFSGRKTHVWLRLTSSGFTGPARSALLLPVVPLHQSAGLLNTSIMSVLIASHRQLGPASSCSAAARQFKDLKPGVKKHVYSPPVI